MFAGATLRGRPGGGSHKTRRQTVILSVANNPRAQWSESAIDRRWMHTRRLRRPLRGPASPGDPSLALRMTGVGGFWRTCRGRPLPRRATGPHGCYRRRGRSSLPGMRDRRGVERRHTGSALRMGGLRRDVERRTTQGLPYGMTYTWRAGRFSPWAGCNEDIDIERAFWSSGPSCCSSSTAD